ncbi:hypothetical protein MNBD_GAMMA01-2117 [hydrothermal vent metagenome]|uniref:Uncharacterized protein n=1 Tax=hydrothermal vent metagenome TaxID=652676 RepID=A0A3B0V2V6_9ZZZZ
MNRQNLANLTTQYQQVYLVYCYKVMQYLQALTWLAEQKHTENQTNTTKVKPKSVSGVKKLAQEVNWEKPTLKSLKHQEKPNVSTIVALGFPNGAMSAAFRVAFNELQGWYPGKTINGQLVDRDGDPKPPGNMILNKAGYWQIDGGTGNFAGAAQENAFGSDYNNGIDSSLSVGAGETNFLFRGTSTEVFKNSSGCVITVDCSLYGLGGAATVNASVKYTWAAFDSNSTKPTIGLFGKLAFGKNGYSAGTSTGVNGNNSFSVSGSKSTGLALAAGVKICNSYNNGSCN